MEYLKTPNGAPETSRWVLRVEECHMALHGHLLPLLQECGVQQALLSVMQPSVLLAQWISQYLPLEFRALDNFFKKVLVQVMAEPCERARRGVGSSSC